MNQQHDKFQEQDRKKAGLDQAHPVRHDDPLLRYLAGSIGLHGKISRIQAHQRDTASSLLRAAAALRSIATARQAAKARA